MKSIDIKSLLIGILGTALVMVLMGASGMGGKYQLSCSNTGQYKMLCSSFDTNQGKVVELIECLRNGCYYDLPLKK